MCEYWIFSFTSIQHSTLISFVGTRDTTTTVECRDFVHDYEKRTNILSYKHRTRRFTWTATVRSDEIRTFAISENFFIPVFEQQLSIYIFWTFCGSMFYTLFERRETGPRRAKEAPDNIIITSVSVVLNLFKTATQILRRKSIALHLQNRKKSKKNINFSESI